MTQEKLYNRVKEEIKKLRNKLELQSYTNEQTNLLNEYNSYKESIKTIKNNNKNNILETQSKRNKKLELKSIIDAYVNLDNISEEEQQNLDRVKEEQKELEEWFNNQKKAKQNTKDKLLQLLKQQEEIKHKIVKIKATIKKFKEKNPTIEDSFNPILTLDSIKELEKAYNTEDFKEEEYTKLKKRFKNQQQIVNTMIETIEEKIKKEPDPLWEEALEETKKLVRYHIFIDKIKSIKESMEKKLQQKQQNNTVSKLIVNNKEVEYHIINPQRTTMLKTDKITQIMNNIQLLVTGALQLDSIYITNNNYIQKIINKSEANEIIDVDSMLIKINNNPEAIKKIQKTNKSVKNIKTSIENNLKTPEQAIEELEELKEVERQEMINIINNYINIRNDLVLILNSSRKRNELSKIALGKTNKLVRLTVDNIKTIKQLTQIDYVKLIIELINVKQYETSISEIKKNYKTSENKTK